MASSTRWSFSRECKVGRGHYRSLHYSWTNVPAGATALTARATDNTGAATISKLVNITVNQPPSVTLTTSSPPFTAGATIQLSATAADSDGTVSKVEFFQGATKLGEDTSRALQLQLDQRACR